MNETGSINNLGTPVAVDVSAIEKELSSYWKLASERERNGAVIRACSCNLVAIAQNRQEAELLPEVLAKVAEWHPSRSVIAYRETDQEGARPESTPQMHAWIGAQCWVPFSGGPQICCETITVSAQGRAVVDLPNTVVSLLVPDLPSYLYWRSFNPADQALVERLALFSRLLIVDSHAAKDDRLNRERLLELLTNSPGRIAVRDLNWSRLTAWRDLIAQFFDTPSSRHYVREIAEVEIHRAVAAPGNVPTRTLLITGWLASRLGWQRVSAEKSGDQWFSRWNSPSGEVFVRFSGELSPSDDTAGISSIILRTRTGATFSVIRESGSPFLKSTAFVQDSQLTHSVPQDTTDEGSILTRELSLTGEDVGFRAALAEALALEKSFS
jgi:glucose-6-phosphate dehydrogenase assembly protein OpcA